MLCTGNGVPDTDHQREVHQILPLRQMRPGAGSAGSRCLRSGRETVPEPSGPIRQGRRGGAAPIPALQSLPLTSCPICSFTLQDYKNVGRLGCSECYNVFEEEILPLLTQIQPDSHHHGKTPERAEKRETETHTISDLEQQLSLAVAREDYERAAKLRDQIKQLRTPTN